MTFRNRMCTSLATFSSAVLICSMATFAQSSPGSMQQQPGATQQPGSSQSQPGAMSQHPDMNSGSSTAQAPAMDKMFVRKALEGGMAEVQLGQLALQKSSNDDVKQFAQKMIDDHTKLGDQMKPIAQQIGAQMYIANVGGPEPILPGGDAAGLGGLVHYVPNMQQLNGTLPSGNQVIPQAQTAALAQAAAQTSQMMQIADATLGGFSNSIATLATQMQQDIDGATVLQFDMTPEDQDIGVPQVEVGLKQPALHAAILDIEPVLSVQNSEQNRASQKTAHDVLAGMSRTVSSPDFAIAQHVDYFPGHSGLEAILPMSCLITWTGHGPRPSKIFIVESVIDKDLSTTVLERQLDSTWEARSVFWERDGLLRPGNYAWRIALADAHGQILASAQRDIRVTYPRQPAVSVSSLVLSKSCDLQQPASGLLHRSTAAQKQIEPLQFKVDPLQLTSCRIKPEPTDSYAATDTLHALVRIYPNGKTEKNRPENWTATFLLRSNAGSIESQQQIPFTIDSQSGLLASAVLPLTGILAGTHSLDVELRGPGLRKPVIESRQVLVQPAFE